MSLSAAIKSIQDILRKDAGVDGDAQRISQLCWMLFLKIFDAQEAEAELMDDDYKSPIPKRFRWQNWAADPEGMTGDALFAHVEELFKTLKELRIGPNTNPRAAVVRAVFEGAYNYQKSGHLLRQVLNKLNEINFNRSADVHQFGAIYEQILSDLRSAGNAGEYYTPRGVTQFIVDMVDPKLGERLLDPACGTGGFLTCAIEHIRANYVKTAKHRAKLQEQIFGVEKKPLPHMLCVTNMLLHGIDVPSQIRHENTLERPLRDYTNDDRVDVIITNPPFGGMEEDGIESNFPASYRTRETADLFLVFIVHLLKKGGRGAIVLPDGTLFGDGVKTRIKQRFFEECNLHTIVRLPKNVFAPYTDIKTNLLFFTKGQPTKEIWYYEHPYPAGYKSYSKTKPLRIEEFEQEKAWWNARVESEFAWRVPVEQIVENGYNLDLKNPHEGDAENHDPDVLLAHHRALTTELELAQLKLRDELAAALVGERREPRDQFIEDFRAIAEAPGGLKRLRKLVLNLAVRGHLDTRESSDEAATELLARIAADKEGLISRKVVKADRQVRAIDYAALPFQLPTGWAWSRFTGVATIASNLVDPGDYPQYPHVAPDNIEKETGRLLEYRTVAEDDVQSSNHLFFPGSLIYSKIRPNLSKAVLVDFEGLCSADMYPLVPYIEPRYLHIYILSDVFLVQVVANDNRIAMPKVNQQELSNVLVPVPPLAEQERIVAKVERLIDMLGELEQGRGKERMLAIRVSEASLDRLVKRFES